MILSIRSDQPEAEIQLYNDRKLVREWRWQADRSLADTILQNIDQIITEAGIDYGNLAGVIVFTGTGSFTGLRIGTTVANAIAYSQQIPVTAAGGPDWQIKALAKLKQAKIGQFVQPSYEHPPNITQAKR